MKLLTIGLTLSLAANAALVTHSVYNQAVDAKAPKREIRPGVSTAAPLASTAATAAASTDVITAMKAGDAVAIRDTLRSAGLSDDMIRRVVAEQVRANYASRIHDLRGEQSEWWKRDDLSSRLTAEQRAELRRLQRERDDEINELLGEGVAGDQRKRLPFLSDEKSKAVRAIERDYQDMMQDAREATAGFMLPSDGDAYRYMQKEKERDLAAILNPEELADYQMRTSQTTNQLKWKMAEFDATEEEFRAVFAAQKAFDDEYSTAYGRPQNTPEYFKARQERQKQMDDEIKAALGDARYEAYMKSQNYEYKQLVAATKRMGLAHDVADEIYDLRSVVGEESQKIGRDQSLTAEQRKAELAKLADQTQARIAATLGKEAADVYINTQAHWLKNLTNGHTFSVSDDRSGNVRLGIKSDN